MQDEPVAVQARPGLGMCNGGCQVALSKGKVMYDCVGPCRLKFCQPCAAEKGTFCHECLGFFCFVCFDAFDLGCPACATREMTLTRDGDSIEEISSAESGMIDMTNSKVPPDSDR